MRELNVVPKWPFFVGDVILLGAGWFVYSQTPPPIAGWQLLAFCGCIALGALLGVCPFILDHRATVKQLDTAALGTATDKLQNLERVAAQITAASNEWHNIQLQAEKTSGASREIAERITTEAQAFTEFMQKANDNERATLRLEVEKLRRAEGDWIQVLIRMLDHVHALYAGALRSGQPRLMEQLKNFQNACHDAARRVGLVPFAPNTGDAFDAARHQTPEGTPPPADQTVGETIAAGFTFQGRMVRPALVRMGVAGSAPAETAAAKPVEDAPESGQLTLGGTT